MPAYIVVEIEVTDPVRYEDYKQLATPSIDAYGGRYLIRGGQVETLEGDWSPKRFVLLQFPSVERAKAWWASPEYAPAKAIRHVTATTQMIVVEGLETWPHVQRLRAKTLQSEARSEIGLSTCPPAKVARFSESKPGELNEVSFFYRHPVCGARADGCVLVDHSEYQYE